MNTVEETPFIQRLRLAKGLYEFHEDFYRQLIECQYKYTSQAFENPDKYVFMDFYIPAEIIHAFDLIPVMSEHAVNFLASLRLVDNLLNIADTHYYNSGTCTFHKPILPAFEESLFAIPKLFLTTTLCNEAAKCFSMVAAKYRRDYFCVDLPYDRSQKAIAYVAEQYRCLTKFLSDLTGIKFDIDKLREIVKKSNIMRNYLVQGNEMRKKSPALLYGANMLRFGGSYSFHGTEDAIRIAQNYYELMKLRRETNDTPVKNEKYRLLWCHLRPFYVNDFFEYIESELGAVIAFEEMSYIYWDEMNEVDPFEGLARKTVDWLFNGDVNRRIELLVKMAQEYDVDGVVHFSHINCRVLNPKIRLLKDTLNKFGIPLLDLSGDCIDRRNFSSKQILTRVEAFTEMLTGRI